MSVQPSLPLRTPSLQSLPPLRETSVPLRTSSLPSVSPVLKPSVPLRASSRKSASSDPSSLDSISDAEHGLALGFAARMPSVHPVLALRYKWRTACAKALQTDTPDDSFISVMQRRGVSLPAPVKTDFVRTVSSAALSSTARRGIAAHLLIPRAPRVARAASLNDAPPADFAPFAAATRRRSSDQDLRLCTAWRTERNTLMRLSPPEFISPDAAPPFKYDSVRPPSTDAPAAAAARRRSYNDGTTNAWRTELNTVMRLSPPNEEEEASRLPGALRCAKAHAPHVRRASIPLS